MSKSQKYLLSYTAAGLMLNESVKIAEAFIATSNWDLVKKNNREDNLLQSRTLSRNKRVFQELSKRLKLLSIDQLALLVEGSIQEQKYLLWFTVCKRYQIIYEFAIEVLYEKFLGMDYQLSDLDYDSFFNRKADWHSEINELTSTTKNKLKQVLFKMMQESGIISEDKVIIPAILSQKLIDSIKLDSQFNLKIFPIHLINQ